MAARQVRWCDFSCIIGKEMRLKSVSSAAAAIAATVLPV